ncbi:MAG TPA: ribosomal protein S18-alanine N-acetyltransferase [Syntrophomonadaceae bacterium]|nr:ribosomal protein S18-alanine N-acetyltransferase [Syntrophomonadaceae bacterium]
MIVVQADYIVRKMTEEDVPRVMDIEKESFTLPWSKQSYLADLKNEFASYLVCEYDGEITAYGGIWVIFESGHITNIAVAEKFRRKGIGTRLMLELENVARQKEAIRVLLEVRPSNHTAFELYDSLDYTPTRIRENYYSDNGEDAIVMTKLIF